MTDVAHTLVNWWNHMADMLAKYGAVADIEMKPEWSVMQGLQEQMLHELHEMTGTAEDVLFENIQHALFRVLGTEATTLDRGAAAEVIAELVRLSVRDELMVGCTSGMLN